MDESPPPFPLPKFDAHSALAYLWDNWAIVRRYWLILAISVVFCGIVVAFVVRALDARQIEILTATNIQLRDQNSALQRTASSSPPSQWRRLSDQDRDTLIRLLKDWQSKPATLAVFAIQDSEARQYAAQFVDALRLAGIEPHPKEVNVNFSEVGLMVGVVDVAATSKEAAEFVSILTKSGLKPNVVQWYKVDQEPGDFDIFIGPKPW
jgi:hypothetical protein